MSTKAERRLYSKRAWDRLTEIVREAKNKPCADCGNSYPFYVMEFDHRPGEAKAFSFGKRATRGKATVLAEIAKCDVVCANCHHERTYMRSQKFSGN